MLRFSRSVALHANSVRRQSGSEGATLRPPGATPAIRLDFLPMVCPKVFAGQIEIKKWLIYWRARRVSHRLTKQQQLERVAFVLLVVGDIDADHGRLQPAQRRLLQPIALGD
jgi:hypothetical protein